MPIRLTLRFRIISLVALFAILIIAAFTALLINRQLQVITENNQYRARVGTFAAKGAFERTLLSTIRSGDPPDAFQKLIPILREGQLAEEVAVANLEGKIVAAATASLKGTFLPREEAKNADYARKTYSPKTWFYARVDPGQIRFYAPVTIDDVPQYVAVFRYSLGNMDQAIRQVSKLCILVAGLVIVAVGFLCFLLTQSLLGPIQELNEATQDIASGNLSQQVDVTTDDELGELAETFNEMTQALVAMKARAENANPLTKLPGNNMIHEAIEKRIKEKKKFVAVYSDLDNFKAFNDKYGIGAGDQAIKLTAAIMKEAMRKGAAGDFLGHEGGDDFIILTAPEKTQAVTDHVCTEFDKRVRQFYSAEDQAQGFIMSKDREGNVKQFPIMTISLAGVGNVVRELTSYAEVTNICAEVKKKAKMLSKETGKSSLYLDKRTGKEPEAGHAAPPPPAAAAPEAH
ncbi:MAG: HAMP domain-containing protein [Candidatus Omnitrophota bacterium]|nr:HAMP domain-containing protein [Candidatus Omnitrophota bacterium]